MIKDFLPDRNIIHRNAYPYEADSTQEDLTQAQVKRLRDLMEEYLA